MKILFVNYEFPPLGGGGGVAMRSVAVQLAQRHQVHVLTSTGPSLAAEETDNGARIFRVPVWGRKARSHASFVSMISFWPIGTRHGRKLVDRQGYDLINTWFAVPSGPTGIHLARRAKVPHVLTMAGGDIYDPSKWYTPDKNPVLGQVVRWVLRSSEAHVAVSTDLAKRAKSIYGFEKSIEVIPLGVEPPENVPAATRAELGLAEDAVYLISVGRLVRRKNLARLIDALSTIASANVQLVVLGDGPERQNLQSLASVRGIADRVHFKGFVSEQVKHQLLRAADIFTLPSLHEAFGLVYLEGMHAGLPVIAARPGGQEDYLTDGETGRLVGCEDTAGLAAAITELAENPQERRRMGDTAQAVARKFSTAATASRYERVFERLVADQPAGAADAVVAR